MDHPAVAALQQAWLASDHAARSAILRDLAPPGPIALRSRYRHLLDRCTPTGPLPIGPAGWQAVLDLESDGDAALQRGDLDDAGSCFSRLSEQECSADHRIITVHAVIGLGDIARAVDDVDRAIEAYEQALAVCVADGYRFGQVRALVPLGYLTMAYASAAAATQHFAAALALAAELGDPLYRANAALGLAECTEHTGDLAGAIEMARAAYAAFDEVRSPIGRANAAYRTGALLHRDRDLDEARTWLERAYGLYVEIGDPVGLSNVLSGLGDLDLDAHRFDDAQRWYAEGLRHAEKTPRARAHALQDLARVARGRGDWAAAERGFEAALAAYREIDDLMGVWNALDKMAEAQSELDRPGAVVRTRMESVFSVEAFRAGHRDERSQREYRDRFALTYSRALTAAIEAGDAAAFAVVADCLAGRRLAGLIEAGARTQPTGDLALLQGLLAHADQRLIQHRRRTAESTREQRIRLLGSMGIRHGLAERAELSLDDQLAAVYLPPERDGQPLLDAVSARVDLLQLVMDPAEPDRVCWLWRPSEGEPSLGVTRLDEQTLRTMSADRVQLRLADLEPLGTLLPPDCASALPGRSLILVPVGDLWMVPWSAIPLPDGSVLGETVRYAVCPSLTVQRQLAERASRHPSVVPWSQIDAWRSPLVQSHELQGVKLLPTSSAAKAKLRDGGEMMVVIGHGRPAPGMGHYLEFDEADWLVPADLLGAATPRRLALIACDAGSIGGRPSDPISLATLALAARSDEVLASVGELGDSAPAARYTERILRGMAAGPLPDAVHEATRWLLGHEEMRTEPILHWAPLIPIGTIV